MNNCAISAGAQELRHFQHHGLVVVRLVRLTPGRERQVVVIAHDDVIGIDILDCEEWKLKSAIPCSDQGLAVRVRDIEKVYIADLAHRISGVGFRQLYLVDTLEFCRILKAIRASLATGAGSLRDTFAVIALDDQACTLWSIILKSPME